MPGKRTAGDRHVRTKGGTNTLSQSHAKHAKGRKAKLGRRAGREACEEGR